MSYGFERPQKLNDSSIKEHVLTITFENVIDFKNIHITSILYNIFQFKNKNNYLLILEKN